MTANQSAIFVANPHTKKAMAVLTKFAKIEAEYKAAEAESKAATELIKEAMIAGGVERVTIDMPGWEGYITLAERVNYKAKEDMLKDIWEHLLSILERDNIPGIDGVGLVEKLTYVKPALDTDKVKAQATLTGQLPAGVIESKTQYITKKIKTVE